MNKYTFKKCRFFEVNEYKFKVIVGDKSVIDYYIRLVKYNLKILNVVKEEANLEKTVIEESKELINTILKDDFFDKIFEACDKDVKLLNIFVLGLVDFVKKLGV